MRTAKRFLGIGLLCVLCASAVTLHSGCAKTPQGKLNQLEITYAGTIGELNDLREAGKISPQVYHDQVAPSARAAYAGIKRARAELKAGNTSEIDTLLKSIDDSLLKLQPLRPGPQSSIQAAPPVSTAMVPDVATIALAMAAVKRLVDAIDKWTKGDELTPEEQAVIQAATDAEAARVETLDAQQG